MHVKNKHVYIANVYASTMDIFQVDVPIEQKSNYV
jgi:hypothetical protein